MGIVSDISSVIGLVAKAKQLADNLKNLELKEVIVDLQGKLLDLKEEIVQLREENAELKRQIKDIPVASTAPKETPKVCNGLYYFGDDMNQPYCARCYEREGKKHPMANIHNLAHKCSVCGNIIHNR